MCRGKGAIKTTALIDITRDACPMTFVKVKMGLQHISPKGKINVRLKEEALKNVISSLKTEGHRVAGVSREGSIFLIEVEKKDEGMNQLAYPDGVSIL